MVVALANKANSAISINFFIRFSLKARGLGVGAISGQFFNATKSQIVPRDLQGISGPFAG